MQFQWVLCLLMSGVAYVTGNSCNAEEVRLCYEDLVHYETLAFPLYGHDKEGLEDTCSNIKGSISCINSYVRTCQHSTECGNDCQNIIGDIKEFLSNTGLEKFATDLCEENSPLRETYLENVQCLEENADAFANCHNDSQKSQSYMDTLHGEDFIGARCCYSIWYDDCFTNVTRHMCHENITMFVSYGIHQLTGDYKSIMCADADITCDRPPLPPEGDDKDNEVNSGPNATENEIDNEIPDSAASMNTAAGQLGVIGAIILSYFSMTLSTHIL